MKMFPVIEDGLFFDRNWVMQAALINFREIQEFNEGDGDTALYVFMEGLDDGAHKASCRLKPHGGDLGKIEHLIGHDYRGRDFALWCALTVCRLKGLDRCTLEGKTMSTSVGDIAPFTRAAELPDDYLTRFTEAFSKRLEKL